eukprot:gene31133-6272_t
MKNSGFAVSSRLVQERIDRRHMEIHNERVAAVTAIVDSSEPEYANRHKGFNAKKTEQEAEKMFEIEAENARIAQRLIYIETLDSTKILRPTTSRSTIFDKSGTFYSDVGGHQCIDHINHNATSNPGSLHYRGTPPATQTSTLPGGSLRRSSFPTFASSRLFFVIPKGSSVSFKRYGGSRGASPMRSRRDSLADSAEFSASVALDSETGIAKRAPSRASSVSGSADFIRTSNPGNLAHERFRSPPKKLMTDYVRGLTQIRASRKRSRRRPSAMMTLSRVSPSIAPGPGSERAIPGRLAQSMGDLPLSRGPSPGRLSLSTDSSPRGLPPKGIPSQGGPDPHPPPGGPVPQYILRCWGPVPLTYALPRGPVPELYSRGPVPSVALQGAQVPHLPPAVASGYHSMFPALGMTLRGAQSLSMHSRGPSPSVCTPGGPVPQYVLQGAQSLSVHSRGPSPSVCTPGGPVPQYALQGAQSLSMHSRGPVPVINSPGASALSYAPPGAQPH